MKLEVKGVPHYLEFKHLYKGAEKEKGKHPYGTSVALLAGNDLKNLMLVAEGKSLCHYKDCFDRAKGRKVALAKMFKKNDQNVTFDKETRTAIWNAYLNR
jgi:hypothetical protein